MKWASMLLVLAMVGCGAAPAIEDEVATRPEPPVEAEPLTPLETVLASCPFVQESVLRIIEAAERNRQAGFTFSDGIDLVNESDFRRDTRDCHVTVLEWVHFGLLPE